MKRLLLVSATLWLNAQAHAGAFIFASEANGLDVRTHPTNYSGTGGTLANLSICLDVSVPSTALVASQAEASIRKAVATYNRLRSIPDNTYALDDATDITTGMIDFESTLLHEMGHCQGLAHPNHANESGLNEPDRNGTKSTVGVDTLFNQAAGLDTLHGSSDDVRGDDNNLHYYQRGVNNPGLLPPGFGSSTLIRALTALPSGQLYAANADRDVMSALGFPNTEAVMQQGAFFDEAQRHLQHDDVTTLRFARTGLNAVQGDADDYSYRLQYVGQLSNPTSAACNLRVRIDSSTSFAVCATSSTTLNTTNRRITSSNLAFNAGTAWFYSPGANTTTNITSVLPGASRPFEPITVRVAVRENAGIAITGDPRGVVEISDGPPGDIYTATCRITLTGTADEVGLCLLSPKRAGVKVLTAQYVGFAGWDASSGTQTHTVRGIEIVKARPNAARTNQGVSVAVNLELIAFGASPQPTGTISVSDGTDSCLITLPARECLWASATEGLKQLQASYSGDANYPALISTRYPLQVGPNRYPELISVAQNVAFEADGPSNTGAASADGRFVVFQSTATTLVSGYTNQVPDIFLYDTQTGHSQRISVDSNGVQANSTSINPRISADGRFVAFTSAATNLVSGDTNGAEDIFLRDTFLRTTVRVSVDSSGAQSDGLANVAKLSLDGRFVAFESTATNLVSGDTNGVSDIFVRDTVAGTTRRVSVDNGGAQTNGVSNFAEISPDGRFVAFASDASNLVSGDVNLQRDIFVRDTLAGTTSLISVDSLGSQSDDASDTPVMSADARFVAFSSDATNLVVSDTNGRRDVFVRDTLTSTTTRISVSSSAVQGTNVSDSPAISADGRYVVFLSSAPNLVSGDTNGQADVFVRDTSTGTTTRVSVSNTGAQGTSLSLAPTLSADARFVVFPSRASNLVIGDINGRQDIFVRDTVANTTRRVSVDSAGAQASAISDGAAISADGRTVVFQSGANNLVSGDTNAVEDIFMRSTLSGATSRISVDSAGVQGNRLSLGPATSADAGFVVFESDATNLVTGDSNGQRDIFMRNTLAETTSRVSVDSSGAQANSVSQLPSISANGRFVAFESGANNLTSGDINGEVDIFLRDMVAGTTSLVSVDTAGLQANTASAFAAISADGRFVAFQSGATNLVAGDSNGQTDIFVRDTVAGTTNRVSVDSAGVQANNASSAAAISADGRFVAFTSTASNLVSGDFNAASDIFVRDTVAGTTSRVSVDSAGTEANGGGSAVPAISADGRFIAFQSSAPNLVSGDSNARNDVFVRDTVLGTTVRASVSRTGEQGNFDSALSGRALSSNGLVAFSSGASNLAAGDDRLVGDVFLTRIPNFVAANSTTTTITADTPDPSLVNQSYSVAVLVTRSFTGANVTGSVYVTDGSESCTATLSGSGASATGSCNLSSSSVGSKNVIASYLGDANHSGSTSAAAGHTVNAATVSGFSATGDSPDPSRVERTVTYSWSLTPALRGPNPTAVVPTGTVTVKEAANCAAAPVVAQHQCSATLPTSSCQIAFASTGMKSTVLCYSGDSSFAAAVASESHEVIAATVPVSLAFVSSRRLSGDQVDVRFSTATNVGTVAMDVAQIGIGARASRSEAGEDLRAASVLIASSGDSVRAADYQLSATLSADRFYVRGFDADGAVQSFGPFTVGSSSGSPPAADTRTYDWTSARSALQQAASVRQNLALRRASAESGVYLHVAQAGIQRVSFEQLQAAGFSALNATPIAELALTSVFGGTELSALPELRALPMQVNSADALFNAGDTLSFIGEPADTQHSGERVYTLKRDGANARRITPLSSGGANAVLLHELPQSRMVRERTLFAPTSAGATPWTWIRIAATSAPVEQSVTLTLPNALDSAASLRVQLQGQVDHDGASLDHHVQIALNGVALGDMRFDGVRVYSQNFNVPAGLLRAGANSLTLRLPADTGLPSDVIALEAVQVDGQERLQAINDRMDVQLPGTQSEVQFRSGFEAASTECASNTCLAIALSGLNADAEVYRVSGLNGATVQRITSTTAVNGELHLSIASQPGDRLVASNIAALYTPSIGAVPDSTQVLSGAAQYLVISHPSFIDALGPLLGARNAQGLTTKLVSTEQIYGAFSGGQTSPEAIARYLRLARSQLGTQYVLLVGGDTLDARGFQNSGSVSFVPTLYPQTSALIRFAPSDPALADTDSDGVPELAIGRFPVRDGNELARVLAKTLSTNPSRRALMVSDRSEAGLDFASISQGLGALLPSYQQRPLSRDQLSADAIRQAIVEETNSGGVGLVQYFGHASPARWGFDNILTASQIGTGLFTNVNQPIEVLQWACWTNYFVDPTHSTLGHAWLNGPGGADLVVGPSTLTETAHDEAIARRLLRILNANPGKPLGAALLEAKRQLATELPGHVDVQLGISILGDPAGR
jgi:hypothetical protein